MAIYRTVTETLDIDLDDVDIMDAFKEVEEAGISLEGFRVKKYYENIKRVSIERVLPAERVKKPDVIFKENATPRHTFPFERPKALPGEW